MPRFPSSSSAASSNRQSGLSRWLRRAVRRRRCHRGAQARARPSRRSREREQKSLQISGFFATDTHAEGKAPAPKRPNRGLSGRQSEDEKAAHCIMMKELAAAEVRPDSVVCCASVTSLMLCRLHSEQPKQPSSSRSGRRIRCFARTPPRAEEGCIMGSGGASGLCGLLCKCAYFCCFAGTPPRAGKGCIMGSEPSLF